MSQRLVDLAEVVVPAISPERDPVPRSHKDSPATHLHDTNISQNSSVSFEIIEKW